MNYNKNDGTSLLMSVIRSLSASENYQQREIEKAKLERAFRESDEIVDKMISQHANDFSTIIQSFSKISSNMTDVLCNIKNIKLNMKSCKNFFNCQRDDLKVLWLEGLQHKFMLELLEKIEFTKTVPLQIENKLKSKLYESLSCLYNVSAQNFIGDLNQIEGLREIKAEIFTKKDRIKYQIIRDLRNHIYIRTTVKGDYQPICDPSFYMKNIAPPQESLDQFFFKHLQTKNVMKPMELRNGDDRLGGKNQLENTTLTSDRLNIYPKHLTRYNQSDDGSYCSEAKMDEYLKSPIIEDPDKDNEHDSYYFIAICVKALAKLDMLQEVFEMLKTSMQSDLCSIVLITAYEIKSKSQYFCDTSKTMSTQPTSGWESLTRHSMGNRPEYFPTSLDNVVEDRPELFRILLQMLFAKFWSIALAHKYALKCYSAYAPSEPTVQDDNKHKHKRTQSLITDINAKVGTNLSPPNSPARQKKKSAIDVKTTQTSGALLPPYDLIDVWSFIQGVFQMTLIEYLAMENTFNSNDINTASTFPHEVENINDYYNLKNPVGTGKKTTSKLNQPLFKFENSSMAQNTSKYAREQRKRKSLAFLATSSLEDSHTNILPPLLSSCYPLFSDTPSSPGALMSPFLRDNITNNPIMVCKPNIKNLRLVYKPVKEFCKSIEKEINLKPPAHCILYSFFSDYISEIYLVDMYNSVSGNIETHLKGPEAWKSLVTFDPKLNPDVDRPLLLNSFIVERSITNLKDIIKDMPDYSNQFLLMICRILQSYQDSCLNIFKKIVNHDSEDKLIISASWAKDEDISRFLKSLPNWILMKHHQIMPRSYSMSINSPLNVSSESSTISPISFMRGSVIESGIGFHAHRDSILSTNLEMDCYAKESEILAANLGNETSIPDYEILGEVGDLKILAHLHESLEWLGQLKIGGSFITSLLKDNLLSETQRGLSSHFDESGKEKRFTTYDSSTDGEDSDARSSGNESGTSASSKLSDLKGDRPKSIFGKKTRGGTGGSRKGSKKTGLILPKQNTTQQTFPTIPHDAKVKDGTIKIPVTSFVLDVFKTFAQDFEDLAELCLLVIHLEIRVHCFYYLIPLAINCNKLTETMALTNGHAAQIEQQELIKLSSTDVDPCILKLNNDLNVLEEVLSNSLQKHKLRYVFDGLGHLLTTLIINTAAHLTRINQDTIKKMCNNIFSLQQNLTNITLNREGELDKARNYWEMLYKSPDEIIDSIIEQGGPRFTLMEYKNAINLLYRIQNIPKNIEKIQLKKLEDALKKPVMV